MARPASRRAEQKRTDNHSENLEVYRTCAGKIWRRGSDLNRRMEVLQTSFNLSIPLFYAAS
jgi:hypothetical protein